MGWKTKRKECPAFDETRSKYDSGGELLKLLYISLLHDRLSLLLFKK